MQALLEEISKLKGKVQELESTTHPVKKIPINKLLYLLYEHHCIDYHRTTFNHKSWHWRNVPEDILFNSGFIYDGNYERLRKNRKRILKDEQRYLNIVCEYGLDGISKDQNDVYHGIQCKLWENTITAHHLGTFISTINNRMRIINNQSNGYLYHTSSLQVDLRDDFKHSGFMNVIKLPYKQDSSPYRDNIETTYVLRSYQEDAVHVLNGDWTGIQLLVLPCGTGKSIIFIHHCMYMQYQYVFIMSPLKAHAQQNLTRIIPFLQNYLPFLIDSDTEGTRDFNDISSNLDKKCIFSSTFKSAEDILLQLFITDDDDESNDDEMESNSYESKYDLSNSILIVDEAHNLLNNEKLIKIVRSFNKVLLVTATPPSQLENIINCETIYNFPMSKAIEEKYICDYRIYLPLITMNDNSDVDIVIPSELAHIDNDMCKKILFFY